MRQMISGKLALRISLLAGLMFVVAAASIGAPYNPNSATATATAPAVQIIPNQGHIHDLVYFTGQGFSANEQVAFYWGVHPFWAAQTDANGNFVSAQHPVQWFAAYSNTITATGRRTGLKASTTFTLLK